MNFVPNEDRPRRRLKNNLERAERGGDRDEIRIAKAKLNKYVAGRTKSVLGEYYEEPPVPSNGPSSASVGGMFDMDDHPALLVSCHFGLMRRLGRKSPRR